jgi:hypothetical protein
MEYLPQSFSNEEGQQYPLGCQAGIEHVSRMGLHGRGNLSEIDFAARKIGPTYVCRLEIHRPRDIIPTDSWSDSREERKQVKSPGLTSATLAPHLAEASGSGSPICWESARELTTWRSARNYMWQSNCDVACTPRGSGGEHRVRWHPRGDIDWGVSDSRAAHLGPSCGALLWDSAAAE